MAKQAAVSDQGYNLRPKRHESPIELTMLIQNVQVLIRATAHHIHAAEYSLASFGSILARRHKSMKPILPLLALILLTGCASVPMADTSLDYEAKKFNPESGKANIYINRGGGVGTALTLQTIFDGRITGTLAPHTYQLLSVPAGEHVVSIGGENQNAAQSKFKAELGKNYFFDVGFSVGWVSPRVHLDMVDEQTGRLELKDSRRAEAANY